MTKKLKESEETIRVPVQERIGRAAYMLSLEVGRSNDRGLIQINIAISMLNIAMQLAGTNETAAMRMYNQARRVARKES
jgi:hypothetical protein